MRWISRFLDWTSEFLATRKGLLPLIGILFILCNLSLQFVIPYTWLTASNLLLHAGIIIAIFGLMLAWAL